MTPPELSRRGLLRLGALLGGSAALAACGGPTISDAGGAAQADIDWSGVQPASEITWWSNHPGTSIELEKEYIRRFQEPEPADHGEPGHGGQELRRDRAAVPGQI